MKRFENPCRIEVIPWEWDWELRDALFHAKGEGCDIPEPHLRFWMFPNGLHVAARPSRPMLLAKIVAWDIWLFQERPVPLGVEELTRLGLSRDLIPREMVSQEEAEEYLELAATSTLR